MLARAVNPTEAARKGERVFPPREGLVPPDPPSPAAMGQQKPRRETPHLCANEGAPTHRASPPTLSSGDKQQVMSQRGRGSKGGGRRPAPPLPSPNSCSHLSETSPGVEGSAGRRQLPPGAYPPPSPGTLSPQRCGAGGPGRRPHGAGSPHPGYKHPVGAAASPVPPAAQPVLSPSRWSYFYRSSRGMFPSNLPLSPLQHQLPGPGSPAQHPWHWRGAQGPPARPGASAGHPAATAGQAGQPVPAVPIPKGGGHQPWLGCQALPPRKHLGPPAFAGRGIRARLGWGWTSMGGRG